MATPSGAEHRDVEQRLRDLERRQSDTISGVLRRQPIQTVVVQYDLASTELPVAAFAEVVSARQSIAVPSGYTRAHVLLFAAAGVSYTGAAGGYVGVQPVVLSSGGPGISNGTPGPGPVSVSSFMARNLVDLDTLGGPLVLKALTYQLSAEAPVSGSGNIHLSASVTFLR